MSYNKELFGFQVQNLSDKRIVFSGDYGVMLFRKQSNTWENVQNQLNYPKKEVLLPLAEEFPPGVGFFVIPDIADLNEKIILRVVVIGHFENKPNRSVGAYADIILNP